jgi:hypothetical protein
MNFQKIYDQLLASPSVEIPILSFVVNLLLTALLGLILKWIYTNYAFSLSNRKLFGNNFFVLAMITMLIISVVKSSLALSLGLVGALSIIRFRAAIKEPEELTYLFLTISIGLGFGADQRSITLIAFLIIITLIILINRFSIKPMENENMYLTINNKGPMVIGLDEIVNVLKKTCNQVKLRRLDENIDNIEISLLVKFENFDQLVKTKNSLIKLDKNLSISFFDNKSIS